MVEEVLITQEVDNQFNQRVKAKIKAIIAIDIHVTDLKKSLNFYINLLGFELVRPPFHPDQDIEDNAIIRVEGGPNIILVKKPGIQNNGRSSIVFTYHTDDIEVVYSVLRDNGVELMNGSTTGAGSGLNVSIPTGIWFMYTQIKTLDQSYGNRLFNEK